MAVLPPSQMVFFKSDSILFNSFKSHINISLPGPGSVLDSCYGGGAPIMILFKISKRPQFYNFVMGARDFRLSNLTWFQKQLSKRVQKNRTRARVRVAKLPHPQTIHCKIILRRQAKKHPHNLDKAPRLSISIVIWILSSDTICQLNQFNTNSETAMLSNQNFCREIH